MRTRTSSSLPPLAGAILLGTLVSGCTSSDWRPASSVVPPFLKTTEQKELERTDKELEMAKKAYDRLTQPRSEQESAMISTFDLADPASLAQKLNKKARSVDRYLVGRLSGTTKSALAKTDSDAEPLQNGLVQDLNGVIRGRSIYDEQRFRGVKLKPETRAYASQNPQGKDVARLNRMLLEDAYPDELWQTSARRAVTEPVARREAEVERIFARKRVLDAQVARTTALWDKRIRDRGYFAIGNKAVIIGMGIAIAALSVANPAANAIWIAGLGAGAAGLVGIEARADEVGFSMQIFQAKGDALNNAAKEAAAKFEGYNEIRLRAMAVSPQTTEAAWETAMTAVGDAMNSLDIAARYTRSTVTIAVVPPSTNTGPAATIQPATRSPLLSAGDFTDLRKLATRLKTPEGSFDKWLADQLYAETKKALQSYLPATPVPALLQADLLQDLNHVLQSRSSIYDEERFKHKDAKAIELRQGTKDLLSKAKDLQGGDLLRLNRLLLEDAYPLELERIPKTP